MAKANCAAFSSGSTPVRSWKPPLDTCRIPGTRSQAPLRILRASLNAAGSDRLSSPAGKLLADVNQASEAAQTPMRPEEAGPAADALYDVFELAFSPLGLGIAITVIGLAYGWDLFSASQGRTLLGQKYEEPEREEFFIRFSIDKDGFYESPISGGVNKIEKNVQYIEEFSTYDACITLARTLQREFGKERVRYQTFSSKNGGEYTYKKGEAPAAKEQGGGSSGKSEVAGVGGGQKGAAEKEGNGVEDGVDAEWAKLMNSMKLTSKQGKNGLENVEVTYITGENACRLCNGKGVRGCSKCSVPSASQEEAEKWTGGADCGTCLGRRTMPCEWCGGSGLQVKGQK